MGWFRGCLRTLTTTAAESLLDYKRRKHFDLYFLDSFLREKTQFQLNVDIFVTLSSESVISYE